MRKMIWLGLILGLWTSGAKAQAEESCGPDNLCWPVLKRNANGPRVTALQFLLRAKGFKLAPGGRFGYSTESALRKFQAKNKLQVDGKLGWQSWEALAPVLKAGAKGDTVRALQTLVNWADYSADVKRDGAYGNTTRKAVLLLQKDIEGVAIIRAKGQASDVEWCYASGGHLEGE